MILYLVRHGQAKNEQDDPSRPLTPKGAEDVTRVASYVSGLSVNVKNIFHSNKLRAIQTAEIFSNKIRHTGTVEANDGLHPLDDPYIWARRLKDLKEPLMLVGHLPHLSKLACVLLCGIDNTDPLSLYAGGVACLKRDDEDIWAIQWLIGPDMIV